LSNFLAVSRLEFLPEAQQLPYLTVALTNFAVVPQNHLAAHVGVHDLSTLTSSPAVKNQWNGMVEWNTGMEYWNDI